MTRDVRPEVFRPVQPGQAGGLSYGALMGEEVEGRKQFIMKRSISNMEEIDYGA
jgi:hypothetical protein